MGASGGWEICWVGYVCGWAREVVGGVGSLFGDF